MKKIAIASDHGGYEYKKILVPYLKEKGYQVFDLGCLGWNLIICIFNTFLSIAETIQTGTTS